MICRTRGEHANHYNTHDVQFYFNVMQALFHMGTEKKMSWKLTQNIKPRQ
jgi:hypothetical protein